MKTKGFTFIETIVVLAVLAMVLPALFTILFAIMQQQVRVLKLQELKRQGDQAFGFIKDTLRKNSYKIYSDKLATNQVCLLPTTSYTNINGNDFYLKSDAGSIIKFYKNGTKLELYNSITPSTNRVYITDPIQVDSFTIACNLKSAFSSPLISVVLKIKHSSDTTVVFSYSTIIHVRK
ncbi:MAG: type II secretion system protein [Candidatus Roizmanbacteria bacterium]